jgi:glycerol 3-phosphatase-2
VPSSSPILLDIDGVVWLMHKPLPGALSALEMLRESGRPFAFVTNNSFRSVREQESVFAGLGIDARGRVLTSAQAAARLVDPASRVLIGAGDGVMDALRDRQVRDVVSVESSPEGHFDAVVVGFHRHFSYDGLHLLSRAVRSGATFIATNDDATYPTPDGPIPGGGSIVAAVSTASGESPVIAGKPHRAMADLVGEHFVGHDLRDAWMVGDRLSTDGAFARQLGCRFAHVRSNVSESRTLITPDLERESLLEVLNEINRLES